MNKANVWIAALFWLVLGLALPGMNAFANSDMTVAVADEPIEFDVEPVIVEHVTLVQLRPLYESIGLELEWNQERREIVGQNGEVEIVLQIGSTEAMVNGLSVKLPLAPRVIAGYTFVPVRFVAESTGHSISHDPQTQTIAINAPPDREEYIGDLVDGLRHGYGKLYQSGILVYEGEFANDVPHGEGLMYDPETGRLRYEGEFRNGRMHGHGKLYREDGTLWYDAEFVNGEINGHGTVYFPYGHRLEVDFVNGMPTGQGTYYYGDGTIRFEGTYKHGFRNGFGIAYYANGNKMHEGEYVNGELVRGKLYYESGELWYEGEFRQQVPHGTGTEYHIDGSIRHSGQFINGQPDINEGGQQT